MTVIVPVIGDEPVLLARKAGVFPVDPAPSPISVFELDQLNVAPEGLLLNAEAGMFEFTQADMSLTVVMTGIGFTVTIPESIALHPDKVYVTVYVDVALGLTLMEDVTALVFQL
jgi:hypothetical protein